MDKSERYLRLLQLLEDIQNPEWGRLTWVDFRDATIAELRESGFTHQELDIDLNHLLGKYLAEDTVSGYHRCRRIANWIAENNSFTTQHQSQ
jgi:hypothetical protein